MAALEALNSKLFHNKVLDKETVVYNKIHNKIMNHCAYYSCGITQKEWNLPEIILEVLNNHSSYL